jgi:hypothetical protein
LKALDAETLDFELDGPPILRRGGIQVGPHTHALISLTCPFDALPRQNWHDVLGSARALGFRMIDVVVVWRHHEAEPGQFDFGEDDPQLDLGAFLAQAQRHGLFACVRPGPRQPALWGFPHAGLPSDVASTGEQLTISRPGALSRTAEHSLPSLADPSYLARAENWLERVGEVLRPWRHPRGPVIGAHLECAATLGPYEAGPGDSHPEAIAAFRAFAKGRYERPSVLRAAYGDGSLEFTGLAAPRAHDMHDDSLPLSPHLDWAACQLELANTALDRFAGALARTCPALPTSVPEFETRSRLKLRLLDVDVTQKSEGRRWHVAPGTAIAEGLGGRLPLVDVELGAANAEPFRTLSTLAAGSRGVCLLPGFEVPGVVRSWLTSKGDPSHAIGRLAPLLAALENTQLHALRVEPCVHIVVSERLLHLSRLERAHEFSAGWFEQGFALERERRAALPAALLELEDVRRMLGWLEATLARRGVPYRHCFEWELDNAVGFAPWIVLPTLREMDAALVETIRFAERRGLPFSIGPSLPSGVEATRARDAWPLLLASDRSGIERQIATLIEQGDLPRRDISPPEARVLFHVRPEEGDDALALAFVLNPTGRVLEVSIACPGYEARDALTQAPIASFAERLSLDVPAESVRMLELFRRDAP